MSLRDVYLQICKENSRTPINAQKTVDHTPNCLKTILHNHSASDIF